MRKVGMRDRHDKGAVLITIAICLFLLMGIAALAIDGGVAYNERRSTQGAADHAALAAAWAACNAKGEAAAVEAGRQAAANNGYDDSDPEIEVTVRRLGGSQAKYEVVIRSTNQTEFGASIGAESVSVESRAVADCRKKAWGGGYALFADGPPSCTTMELDFNGKKIQVHGLVHSNGDLNINGNTADKSIFHDLVTYVGTSKIKGADFPGPDPEKKDPQPEPHQIDFTQFEPAQNSGQPDYYLFDVMKDKDLDPYRDGAGRINHSGVFFARTQIQNIYVEMAPGHRATFVSPGPIAIQPGSEVLAYHSSGVAVYSNYRDPASCANQAIHWRGAARFEGLVYAPRGLITFSMSSGATSDGAIVGFGIELSGSDYVIQWKDVTGGNPEFELEFEE